MINSIVKTLYGLLLSGVLFSCRAKTFPSYVEDLSAHRTLFPTLIRSDAPVQCLKHESKTNTNFIVAYDITSRLKQLLFDLKSYDEMTMYIAGYTIQVYNGTNRATAFQIKEQLCAYVDYVDLDVQYKQPNFTVQVGRFLDRLEAYLLYMFVKKYFPQAIIRPTSFPNKPGTFELAKPIEAKDNLLCSKKNKCFHEETIPAARLPVDSR